MGTLNNAGQNRHDGQKNYQHSNQRNRDNVRDNTAKHRYAEHEEETNDANFVEGHNLSGDMDFRDKMDNLEVQSDED
jgi:hypothetical protein